MVFTSSDYWNDETMGYTCIKLPTSESKEKVTKTAGEKEIPMSLVPPALRPTPPSTLSAEEGKEGYFTFTQTWPSSVTATGAWTRRMTAATEEKKTLPMTVAAAAEEKTLLMPLVMTHTRRPLPTPTSEDVVGNGNPLDPFTPPPMATGGGAEERIAKRWRTVYISAGVPDTMAVAPWPSGTVGGEEAPFATRMVERETPFPMVEEMTMTAV
ncbi:MAG: hypothetical protein Q9170_006075 [Blastenia crenularia]